MEAYINSSSCIGAIQLPPQEHIQLQKKIVGKIGRKERGEGEEERKWWRRSKEVVQMVRERVGGRRYDTSTRDERETIFVENVIDPNISASYRVFFIIIIYFFQDYPGSPPFNGLVHA